MDESSHTDGNPKHIAVIMDGNGRWATARRRPRAFGHQAGVKTVRRIVEDVSDLGVRYLTLYSFSTENWSRPKAEVAALFNLLKQFVDSDLDRLDRNNVRVRIIGRKDNLRDDLLRIVEKVEQRTAGNNDFFLNIAFNYGGRDDILRAAQKLIREGVDADSLSESMISEALDTADMPDPDLLIRTGGEKRISNFLMWQAAYAELIFSDVLWPDFSKADLEAAVQEFKNRTRRFGGVIEAEVA